MRPFGILFTNPKNGRRFLMVEESPTFYTVYTELYGGTGEFSVKISMSEKDYLKSFKIGAIWAGGEAVNDFDLISGLVNFCVDPVSKREFFELICNGGRLVE